MKSIVNLALFGTAAYLGYKLYVKTTPLPPEQNEPAETPLPPLQGFLHGVPLRRGDFGSLFGGALSSNALSSNDLSAANVAAPTTAMYATPTTEVPFLDLDENTKTILLRYFAADYTSPRMLSNDALYNKAVSAANRSGAPCGWIQFVLSKSPNVDIDKSAIIMLIVCDDIVTNVENVDIVKMRECAIEAGIKGVLS